MLGEHAVHATIATADIGRARAFYEGTLGLAVETEDAAGGILYRSGSSRLYLYPSAYAGHAQHTLASWVVDDLDSIVAELAGKGVSFEVYDLPDLKTDERGIAELGTEKAAWFKDPDGNILSVSEEVTGG